MSERVSDTWIDELLDIAVRLGLHDRRQALLLRISPGFQSNLPSAGERSTPRDQLASDLHRLNGAGLLEDGSDPFKIWLENAHGASGGVAEAEVFQRALAELARPASHQQAPQFLRLGGATWLPPAGRPEYQEAVIHCGARVPIPVLEDAQRASESVALVSVPRFNDGRRSTEWDSAKGTGWLIGPRLLVTAYHVVNARRDGEPRAGDADLSEQALNAQVTFGYDRENRPGTVIHVTALAARNDQLDYAILRLDADPDVPPLQLATDIPTIDNDSHPPLSVVAHPLGEPKMLGFRDSLATSLTERPTDLGYFTFVEQSASGAPVFDDEWRVVAMHRATAPVAEVRFQGHSTAWANVGTRITAIQKDLEERYQEVWRLIQAGQAEESRPRLSVVRTTTSASAQRLHESTDALRRQIQSIVSAYDAEQGLWVWHRVPLQEELDRIHRQLKMIEAWLADDELSRSELRDVLSRHGAAADRFAQRLNDLDTRQTLVAQRSMRARDFELAGESLLDLLVRIEEQVRLLGPGDNPPGSS